MKKNIKPILLLSLYVFTLLSCNKTKDLLDITYNFTSNNNFTLPKVGDKVVDLPDTTVVVKTPNIVNTVPDEFKKNNVDINKIKSLSIEGMELEIKSPSGQTFNFMKSIKISMGVEGKSERIIGMKEKINEISPAVSIITLDVQQTDILEYIKSPTYYLKIETGLAKSYTSDIVIESRLKGKVVANPLN
jgi:hypothetical protein